MARSAHILELLANGTPSLLGTIVSTGTTKNNHDTAAPFNNSGSALGGMVLCLQPTAAGYLKFGAANNVAATSADLRIEQHERVIVSVHNDLGFLAWLPVTGSADLKVARML